MKDIISRVLTYYNYNIEDIKKDNLIFYKPKADIASYILGNYIDCIDFETDSEIFKERLAVFEEQYISQENSEESIMKKLRTFFKSNQEFSQLNKNLSVIYLLKFKDLNNLQLHQNTIYEIEESSNYFKRYILPYSDEQLTELQARINKSREPIPLLLSTLAEDEEGYINLSLYKNKGTLYELVIRLFSKIPCLQYNIVSSEKPKEIKDEIEERINNDLIVYYEAILSNKYVDLESLLRLTVLPQGTDIDSEIDALLKEKSDEL